MSTQRPLGERTRLGIDRTAKSGSGPSRRVGEYLSTTPHASMGRGGRSRSRQAIAAVGILALRLSFANGCCCLDQMYCPTGCDGVVAGGGGYGDCCGTCGVRPLRQCAANHLGCGMGCGNVYVGEWVSDPPDRCDPCDGCGNWTGPRCCPPGILQCLCQGLRALFCCPQPGCCEAGSGCTTCGGHGEIMSGDEYLQGVPTQGGTPRPAEPMNAPPPQAKPNAQTRHAVPPRRSAPAQYRQGPVRPIQVQHRPARNR